MAMCEKKANTSFKSDVFAAVTVAKAKAPQVSEENEGKLRHVAALLTLKANWFDTLTVKQWEIMIINDVLLFSVTNEDTPYEQLLHCADYS